MGDKNKNYPDGLLLNLFNKTYSIPVDFFSSNKYTKESKDALLKILEIQDIPVGLSNIYELHEEIRGIEQFFRGKKKIKDCFKKGSLPFLSVLPYLFVSRKEASIGKQKENRKIMEQDLNDIDFSKIQLIECPENFTKIDILDEIRNAIEHNKCVYTKNGYLIIDNPGNPPKHAYNFKAIVNIVLLTDFVTYGSGVDRRSSSYHLDCDSEFREIKDLKIEDIKEHLIFRHKMYKESVKNPIIIEGKSISEISNQVNERELADDEVERKELELTDKQCQMILDFFKKHHRGDDNLHYVGSHLINNNYFEESRFRMIKYFWEETNWDNKYEDFIEYYYNSLCFDMLHGVAGCKHQDSPEVLKVIETIINELPKMKQKNGQPLLWHQHGILDFIRKKFNNAGFKFDGERDGFKKGNNEFGNNMLYFFVGNLIETGKLSRYDIEGFPDRLKIQVIRMIYANIPLSALLQIEKLNNSIVEDKIPSNNQNGKTITEAEHIRNALAHNNITYLHGIDYILLRDGYNKKTNSWKWEEKYDLNELYENSKNLTMAVSYFNINKIIELADSLKNNSLKDKKANS